MSTFYDVVIVGSGASGSVIANYLVQAGARVLLLEAGSEFSARTFPHNELLANSSLYWNGSMDATTSANLLFLRGKVLGGGTVVNQALMDRFDTPVWDEWRQKSGIQFYNDQEMSRHYAEIESNLALHTLTRPEWNRNAQLYVEGFDKLGYRWGALRRGQSNCKPESNDCMACLGGCRRDSKQSMLITFLRKARQHGLEVRTEFMAERIIHHRDRVEILGRRSGVEEQISARRCVLAAGTLGTNQLMLRSGFGADLPALGKGLYGHPQWMNIALFDQVVDAHKGALQAVKSDEPRFRAMGFKLENVFVGPIGITMLMPSHGLRHQQLMERYRHMASMEVCIRDVLPGTIRVNRKGRLRITKPLEGEDLKRGLAGVKIVRELYQAVGAREFISSNFNFSLHQMGGCAIGINPATAVVNERFQVFGRENLTIADGSVFPLSSGINPALSIMAHGHRASQVILEEFGAAPTSSVRQESHHG